MPRVTVVIATYNWSTVLPYSIGSALRQTFTDFEIVVVGDGCTDDSESVVAAIGDPRIRWINLPINSGHQSTPNNEGLRQARGEIIAHLGHDDLWLPHHLAALVGALDREQTDLAYGIMALVSPGGSVWPTMPRPRECALAPPSGVVYRKRAAERIGGWRHHRGLTITPEFDLFRRMRADGCRFTFVPRLTGIKFPAMARREVYKLRPCHEQAEWLARIDAEPDLEARLLVKLIVEDQVPTGLTYRDLVQHLIRQTISRVRRRLFHPWMRGGTIDELRRFKGL
jgi:glycosyltransferase involved in cell wall biosynthesis